jgi:uncharacterized membrane protein
MMISRKALIYLLFLFPTVLWVALILLAPYLESIGSRELAGLLYFFFKPTCHQLAERSFIVFGYPMAVCARCFGIYAGFLAATLIYPLISPVDNKKTPSKWLLLLAVVPMGLDGGIQLLTSYESNNLLRLVTGMICGGVLPFYILPVYNELFYGFLCRKQII